MSLEISACIFDLDGVLVNTVGIHYRAWRRLANALGFDIPGELSETLKGANREESFEIILRWGDVELSPDEKTRLLEIKNQWYLEMVKSLGPEAIIPGARPFIEEILRAGYRTAIGSASKNAKMILSQIDFIKYFEVIVDGNSVKASKPDPKVFLKVARSLNLNPANCVVFEDSKRGLQSARSGGFKTIGIGKEDDLSDFTDVIIPSFVDQDINLLEQLDR